MEPAILFLLAPSERDQPGLLRSGTRAFASAFLRRGFLPYFEEAESETLLADITETVEKKNVKAIFSVGGWGLDAPGAGEKNRAAAFSQLGIPVIHTLADPPFSSWIIPKLRCSFANRVALTVDRSFAAYLESRSDIAGRFVFSSPAIAEFSTNPLRPPPPIEQREIEMMFAGVVLDAEGMRQRYSKHYPHNTALFEALFEAFLWEYRTPFIDLAAGIFAESGRPFDPLDTETGFLLEVADFIVRSHRRVEMLARLANYPMTIVTRFPRRLPACHPDSTIIKNLRFDRLLEMTKNVKIMPIAQPTYSDGITERILYAMNYGCAVATSTNNEIERAFRPGEDLLLFNADFSNADEIMDRLRDPAVLRQLRKSVV